MMNDMVERYIHAVATRLPHKIRVDVKNELAGIIQDMLDERCGEIPPTEHDIRVVLTELGTPDELSKKYNTETHAYLIGPEYYYEYKKVLLIVLAAMMLGIGISSVMGSFINPIGFSIFFELISTLIGGVINAFAFVTAFFVFFERRKIKFNMAGNGLDNLPPLPKKHKNISRAESIAGIAFCVLFAFLFLLTPNVFGYFMRDGVWQSLFNAQAIRSMWFIVIAFSALGIIRECVKLHEGKYTRRVAAVCTAADGLSMLLAYLFLRDGSIISREFLAFAKALFGDDGAIAYGLFANIHMLLLAVIIFALLLDMGTVIWHTMRQEKE